MTGGAAVNPEDQAALALLASDAQFFHRLFLDPSTRSYRSVAALALLPNLSAFLVDSAEYVRHRQPSLVAVLRPHDATLRASRLRMKLLDNDRRSFVDLLSDAERLAKINSSWFTDGHTGILAPIKRFLQDDLGLFFIQGTLTATSHTAFLNMGLSEAALVASSLSLASLGPHLRDASEDYGSYAAAITKALGIASRSTEPEGVASVPAPSAGRSDVKSERFYASICDRIAPNRVDMCILFTSVLSQINSARLVVPHAAGLNDLAILKAQLVAVIHSASSLQKLIGHNRTTPVFYPQAEQELKALLGAPEVRSACKYNKLRNALVHYSVHSAAVARLLPAQPYCGAVEAHTGGKTTIDMIRITTSALDHMSSKLEALLFRERPRPRFALES